jgi:hypothetical protein
MAAELRRIDPDRLLDPADCYLFGMGAMGAGEKGMAGRFFRRGLRGVAPLPADLRRALLGGAAASGLP